MRIARFVEDDLATVRFDVETETGFQTGRGVDTGRADLDESVLMGAETEHVAWSTRPRVAMTIPLVLHRQASIEDVRALYDALTIELNRKRNIFEWRPDGATSSEFFDTYRAPIPGFYRGQDSVALETLLFDPAETTLVLMRDWAFRETPVTIDTATLSNAVGDREVIILNPGTLPSEIKVTVTPSAGDLAEIRYSRRSTGDLTEHADQYSADSTSWSLKLDTALDAYADASGGQAATVPFGDESMERRFRDPRVFVDPESMEGTHMAYVRCRPNGGATKGVQRLKLAYGFHNSEIVMEMLRRVEVDWRDVSGTGFVEIPLGLVTIEKGAPRVNLDLYASRISGDQALVVDQIILEPADELRGIAPVPGWRHGGWGHEQFDLDDFDGTGHLRRSSYRLNDLNEYVDAGPDAGRAFVAGIHSFTFEGVVHQAFDPSILVGANPPEAEVGVLQVLEMPGNVLRKEIPLRSKKNQYWTRRDRTLHWEVTAGDVAGGKKFKARVKMTADNSAGVSGAGAKWIDLERIVHRFMMTITNDAPLVIDSMERRAYAESAAATAFPVLIEGALPMAPPGSSSWVFSFLDAPVDPGYKDIDENGPTARSVLARTCDVDITITPRRFR